MDDKVTEITISPRGAGWGVYIPWNFSIIPRVGELISIQYDEIRYNLEVTRISYIVNDNKLSIMIEAI